MARLLTELPPLYRDGTSQAARLRDDLLPQNVRIDERSIADHLKAAKALAEQLRFYDATSIRAYYDHATLPTATWAEFLAGIEARPGNSGDNAPAISFDEVAAFVDQPDRFADLSVPPLRRPHVILFLTFLYLLRHAQNALNGLTGRHLDFYYRTVLGLAPRAAVPDRVFVLFEPGAGVAFTDVPDGTLLAAGRDASGRDRRYRVEVRGGEASDPASPRSLIVSRARIAKLSSVHADIRRTGIAEARRHTTGTVDVRFLAMLRIALGDPNPGDPPPKDWSVDFARLKALAALVDFADTSLFLKLFELRLLITTKRRQDDTVKSWEEINGILEKAGKTKRKPNDPTWTLDRSDPRAFDANLEKAIGLTKANFNFNPDWFGGISQVDNLNDLYKQLYRGEIKNAIKEKMFLNEDEFARLMDAKLKNDKDWEIINGLMQQAGKKKRELNDPTWTLDSSDPTRFTKNFMHALDPVDFASIGIDDNDRNYDRILDYYYDEIVKLETYFFMSAESFSRMMAVAQKKEEQITPADWERVDAILSAAYGKKVYAGRRSRLKELREAAHSERKGLDAILAVAVGPRGDADIDALDPWTTKSEQDLLDQIEPRLDATPPRTPLTLDEWQTVYDIVERAQRKRERLPKPIPQKEEWRNLFAFADATAATAGTFGTSTSELPRWKPFGRPATDRPKDVAPVELIGFAIASPALMLTAGDRLITLTLGFHGGTGALPQLSGLPFRVLLTTAKGWSEAASVTLEPDPRLNTRQLSITITIAADADPVAPLPAANALPGCPWPMLKLMLRQLPPDAGGPSPYALLRALRLARVHLQVAAGSFAGSGKQGLAPLFVENDESVLNGKKPFLPFGHTPATGSRLYVGHPDLFHKRLTDLKFNLSWMGGPADLAAWYGNYDLETGSTFTADIRLIDDGFRVSGEATTAPLFAETGQDKAKKRDATAVHAIAVAISDKRPLPYVPDARAPRSPEVRTWDRYLQWTLGSPDFKHATYPAVAAGKSLTLAADIATHKETITASDYTVNPPYTPKLASLSLDYQAAHEIVVATYQRGPQADQLFHIHPFGAAEVTPPALPGDGVPLLPAYDKEGEFTIGLSNVVPPQTLSILFQMADGSADPDLERQPVSWSYLDGDRWIPFIGDEIVQDTTRGLINSGIIEFRLKAVSPPTLMPADLYWLRAVIARNSGCVCDAVALHPNAAVAVFVDAGNAPAHYEAPLPPNSITAPVQPLSAIGAVRQPYTSFGGKAAEADAAFYTRVSERLRHKQRALTLWDYERLILDRFPQIYKAKCLPASLADDPQGLGNVRIVVIPDIRNRRPFDPFQPKPSADLIDDIEAYLAKRVPPTVRLTVMNPQYIQVRIRVGVRFREAGNDEFFKAKLTDQLNRFLSPWAYDDGADIIIGRRIYANSIVSFIDQRPYVDFVAGIKLFSIEDGETTPAPQPETADEGYFVQTDRPGGILVAAREHVIDIIGDEIFEDEVFTGINYMKIELDFVVG